MSLALKKSLLSLLAAFACTGAAAAQTIEQDIPWQA
jgi:hypothetical protein